MIDLISLILAFFILVMLAFSINLMVRIKNFEKEKEFYNLFMVGVFLVILSVLIDGFYLFNLTYGGFGIDFNLVYNIVKVFLLPFTAICLLASIFVLREE
ncbi:MAG: hypothetical protein PHE43_04005 [Candidatus Nanoarchaeia archaeon]|nr:hypothetical protein [Candidatus Nanoarchaeia archaeon]